MKKEKRIEEFENMSFGMFIHWGLYSLIGRGEWVMHLENIPDKEYRRLADEFMGECFNAEEIADLAAETGMKYAVFTTRHHDGYSLYDTKGLNEYDSVHCAAERDFAKEFVNACRKAGIKPVFYHTTLDWSKKEFEEDFDAYLEYLRKSVEILCTEYGEIGGLWFDGNWSRPDDDWKLDELYGMIRKLQPDAMIINNTGLNARGELGHSEIDSVTFEQGLPCGKVKGKLEKYIAGEMCSTLNDHWGYGRNDLNYKSPAEVIKTLCRCRRAGANLLLNIGPDGTGKIPAIMKEILYIVGKWTKTYADAVYGTCPDNIIGEGENFGLRSGNGRYYLYCFDLPIIGDVNVTVKRGGFIPQTFTGIYAPVQSVRWMDNNEELKFIQDTSSGVLTVNATGYKYGDNYVVRVAEVFTVE